MIYYLYESAVESGSLKILMNLIQLLIHMNYE